MKLPNNLPARSICAKQNTVICFDDGFTFLILILSSADVQQSKHQPHAIFRSFDFEQIARFEKFDGFEYVGWCA